MHLLNVLHKFLKLPQLRGQLFLKFNHWHSKRQHSCFLYNRVHSNNCEQALVLGPLSKKKFLSAKYVTAFSLLLLALLLPCVFKEKIDVQQIHKDKFSYWREKSPTVTWFMALKLSHRYHRNHRSITVGTYLCTLIRRVFRLSIPWSNELEERSSGIISRLSHSEVWFCSWSNTNMAIPAIVAISSGLVTISSNRNWQPNTMSESGQDQTEVCRYYLSVFASK